MNIENNLDITRRVPTATSSREIVRALDESTLVLPIAQILQELQLMVERLTFAIESGDDGRDMALTSGEVTFLLGNDVSPALITFALWLQSRGLLGIMSGKAGRHFLSFCIQYYRSVREITCSVPITVQDDFKARLITQLRTIFPEPARIIFKVAPSLMAGCVIDDGQNVTDLSLAGRMPILVTGVLAKLRPASEGMINGS